MRKCVWVLSTSRPGLSSSWTNSSSRRLFKTSRCFTTGPACTEQVQHTRSTHLHIKNTSPKTVFTDITTLDNRARVGEVKARVGVEPVCGHEARVWIRVYIPIQRLFLTCPSGRDLWARSRAEELYQIFLQGANNITMVLCVRERWTDSTTESAYSLTHRHTLAASQSIEAYCTVALLVLAVFQHAVETCQCASLLSVIR